MSRSARDGDAAGSSRRARGSRPSGPTPGSPADRQPDADPEQVARTILLRRLTAAPRTRAQLAGDLAARGVPEDVAVRVLDRFEEVGLVDDAAFAEAWVRGRHDVRGLGRRALAAELRQRGVSAEDAEEALEGLDADAERVRATELVRRRLPSTARLAAPARTRRLVAMLVRKGYSPGLAGAVVQAALAAESPHEPGCEAALEDEETAWPTDVDDGVEVPRRGGCGRHRAAEAPDA